MDIKLSTGTVAQLMNGKDVDKPVFQILGYKKIGGGGGGAGGDRFRMNISDGVHTHTFAMLATQLNAMVTTGELDNNCVIRAEKYVSNIVPPERRVLIILELTILAKGSEVGAKIGNPVAYGSDKNASMAAGGGAGNGTAAEPKVKVESSKTASAFYGSKPSATNNQYEDAKSTVSSMAEGCIPIRDINPYNNKCTIKARVTSKSGVRTWSNARGDGKLFSMDLLDESAEIRMTGFNTAVDQFYDLIKVNEVYLISKFTAKPANRQFNPFKHDYEISFNNDTQVVPCFDDSSKSVPSMSFNFMEIAFIEQCDRDAIIDVIGVCKKRGELASITTKRDGKELAKRELTLVDRTNTEVSLTLWGKQAEEFLDDTNPVIAIKGAKVGDFNGRNLSVTGNSTLMINPDIQQAHILRGWYDNEGFNMEAKSLTGTRGGGPGLSSAPWKMLREASAADNNADAGFYFKTKVTVSAIKRENAMYKACPAEKCNKKVVENGGMYRCEKCSVDHNDYKWRLIPSVNFADASDALWATCFQEQGELLLDNKADVLGALYSDDPGSFDGIINASVFKSYIARFRGKFDTYNGENRLKYTVLDLQPLNYAEYAKELLNQIKETMA